MIIELKSPGMKHSVLERIHKITITAQNVADEKRMVKLAAALSAHNGGLEAVATQTPDSSVGEKA